MLISLTESFGQATYTWNQTGTADWTVSTNWTPNRNTPLPTDIIQFTNSATTTATNVPSQTIAQLHVNTNTSVTLQAAAPATVLNIGGDINDDLTVTTGSALNISGDNNDLTISVNTGATGLITGTMNFFAFTANTSHRLIAADASSIIFNNPAIFIQGFRCNGNVFGNTGTSNTTIFNTGSTFIQNGAGVPNANPFALTAPDSKVVFNTGSLYKHQQNGAPSMSGRTYADFELNYGPANIPTNGVNPLNIDNLTITAGQLNLNQTGGVNIKGNISVATGQTLNFNPATTGTLTFNGTTPQSITSAGTLTFGANENVIINNSSGLTLQSDIALNNLVTFTNGIVKVINPKVLTLSSTAIVTGVSNASFVDGQIKKIGNTDFEFPVGKTGKGYVPIKISNFVGGAVTDEFVAEYIRGNARALGIVSAGPGLDHVSGCDYWILNKTNGTPAVDLTAYWSTNNLCATGAYIDNLATVTLAHFDGTVWNSYAIPTVLGVGSTVTAGSVTWPSVSVFSPFSLASTTFGQNPLTINLNYLNGYKQNNHNYLTWKVTCTNNPNATMKLERSTDGKKFKEITSITADALRCQQPFDYTDADPIAGLNYYRLKMTDAYGKVTCSSTIALLNKETGFDIVGLLPSLVNSSAILNVTAAQKTKMDVVVTDIAGRQIQKISFNLIAGSNQFNLNLSGLPAGTYQITGYTVFGKSRTVRFVKQ